MRLGVARVIDLGKAGFMRVFASSGERRTRMSRNNVSVVAIVATYKRPVALRELLESLNGSALLKKVIVVDNGFQDEAGMVCKQAPVSVEYHRPEVNLGCGGGVARGLKRGLTEASVTHFCVFDDDAQATPGAVDSLVKGMSAVSASVAVPLVLNQAGHIGWFPGLQQPLPWTLIRRPHLTPSVYQQICGCEPDPC